MLDGLECAVTTFSTASRARLRHASAGPPARLQSRGREVIEWGCVPETGTTARTRAGAGGATVRLRGGGYVAPLRAEALRARHRRQAGLPRSRRSAIPAVTLRRWSRLQEGAFPVLRAGHPLTAQDHIQGRSLRSRRCAMAQAPPLSVIFPGKTSAPIGWTGQTDPPSPRPRMSRAS